jgi:hypothetical protein
VIIDGALNHERLIAFFEAMVAMGLDRFLGVGVGTPNAMAWESVLEK